MLPAGKMNANKICTRTRISIACSGAAERRQWRRQSDAKRSLPDKGSLIRAAAQAMNFCQSIALAGNVKEIAPPAMEPRGG